MTIPVGTSGHVDDRARFELTASGLARFETLPHVGSRHERWRTRDPRQDRDGSRGGITGSRGARGCVGEPRRNPQTRRWRRARGLGKWWPRAELNHRHKDFQSSALPTELLGHLNCSGRSSVSREPRPDGNYISRHTRKGLCCPVRMRGSPQAAVAVSSRSIPNIASHRHDRSRPGAAT